MRRRFTTPFATIFVVLALIAMAALPAAAGGGGHGLGHAKGAKGDRPALAPHCAPLLDATIEVLHGPVTITLANPDSDGHQVGDLRATSIATTDAAGAPVGRLDATLTTVAIDVPAPGDEIRISTLVFAFGNAGTDQIVVGGTAVYPAQGPTLEVGSVTTRPIQGGSGRFAGASGSAVSEHFPDGSWHHLLHLSGPFASMRGFAVLKAAPVRVRSHVVREAPDRGELDRTPVGALLRALWMRLAGVDDHSAKRIKVRRSEHPSFRRLERRHDRLSGRCPAPVPAPIEGPVFEGLEGAPIDEPGITRNELGRTPAAGVTGQELGLWHYTVPVGAELPPHTHAGSQIARVIDGELEYTVISGDGTIIRSDGTSTPIGPGTYVLRAGDSVVEDPDMEHYGANRGPEVVQLIAATLYPEGAPLSIPLETAAPALPEPEPVLASPAPAATSEAPVPVAAPTPSPAS